jgi:hypothetical protein
MLGLCNFIINSVETGLRGRYKMKTRHNKDFLPPFIQLLIDPHGFAGVRKHHTFHYMLGKSISAITAIIANCDIYN